jgi:hypothetical protein
VSILRTLKRDQERVGDGRHDGLMDLGDATLAAAACLAALPTVAWFAGRRGWPTFRYSVVGLAVGAIATPLSICLYLQFFAGPIRALVLGFPGLLLMAIHLGPGNAPLASHEIVENGAVGFWNVLGGIGWVRVASWAAVYAVVGATFDRRNTRRRQRAAGSEQPDAADGASRRRSSG